MTLPARELGRGREVEPSVAAFGVTSCATDEDRVRLRFGVVGVAVLRIWLIARAGGAAFAGDVALRVRDAASTSGASAFTAACACRALPKPFAGEFMFLTGDSLGDGNGRVLGELAWGVSREYARLGEGLSACPPILGELRGPDGDLAASR